MLTRQVSLTGELAIYIYSKLDHTNDYMLLADSLKGIKLGFGQHIEALDPGTVATIYILFYSLEVFYLITVGLVKISFLILLHTIFEPISRMTTIIKTLGVFTILYLCLAVSTQSLLLASKLRLNIRS